MFLIIKRNSVKISQNDPWTEMEKEEKKGNSLLLSPGHFSDFFILIVCIPPKNITPLSGCCLVEKPSLIRFHGKVLICGFDQSGKDGQNGVRGLTDLQFSIVKKELKVSDGRIYHPAAKFFPPSLPKK